MTPRLRRAIYAYWHAYHATLAPRQAPPQDRGSNIVSLDEYRRKRNESAPHR